MSYWIKTYTEILNDPKIGRLSLALRWRFVEACLLAGSITPSGETGDGHLPALEDAAFMAHASVDELATDWSVLELASLLFRDDDGNWWVTNFAKRQAPSDVTERVKLHRERSAFLKRYGNVSVTTPDTDTDTESDTDTDTELREDIGDLQEFAKVKTWIETATGMPAMPKDVDALRELSNLTDLIEQDVIGAVAWHRDQGRVVHGAAQLFGSIMYNRGKRIQASAKPSKNGSSARKNAGVLQAAREKLERGEKLG